jgi:hypothetical protein
MAGHRLLISSFFNFSLQRKVKNGTGSIPHHTAQPPQDSLPDHNVANSIEAVKTDNK